MREGETFRAYDKAVKLSGNTMYELFVRGFTGSGSPNSSAQPPLQSSSASLDGASLRALEDYLYGGPLFYFLGSTFSIFVYNMANYI